MSPFWLTAFADYPAAAYRPAVAHLQRLTGWQLSDTRGVGHEFASLLPPDGDDFLRVQRLADGPARIHLDLHVDDARAAADGARSEGAELLADKGYQVLRSPGGYVFCFVEQAASRRPTTSRWPDGHSAILDQVCLDIPADRWQREIAFWAAITGWPLRPVGGEFTRLQQPPLPVKLLLQRRDDSAGPVRAHLDWATDDRQAEIARHQRAGSDLVRRFPQWTVMDGPIGTYCITGRRPD
ncbi:VOC family protein [Microlunatus soli]|uniref:VOC family protein n=1 Tax=Microlunatus soli TaxID=630515 RepID=UPI000B83DBF2|nr:VOC family protein [Microlunatus soli]